MFKKFNWGHGITLFYICFVAVVITALVASFSVDHSLVVDDYYAQDLSYQSQYDKAQNSLKSQNVRINNDKIAQALTIDFDNSSRVEGNVEFYRPSDKSKDFNVELKEKLTTIPTGDLLAGKWILKIDWKENGKSYYKEELIYI